MKRLFVLLFSLAFVLLVQNVSYGEMRNWTGSNGKIIEAEFLSFDSATEIVKIKLKNGKEQNVRIDLFSQKDQEFVRNQGKTDNPFGDMKADVPPKTPSKPIDMKFVMAEAKKAMEQFERVNQNQLDMGHLPSVYVDYALIQYYTGQQEEAKKSLETAVKLAESDSDISYKTRAKETYNSNYSRIAKIAIEIGCTTIAKRMIDITKKECGDDSALATSYVLLGNDADAMLSVAKRGNNNSRAFGFVEIGSEYLKMGKIEKAKEMFETADSIGNDWCRNWIVTHWIKSGNIEEAKEYIEKISDDSPKSYALRSIALHYYLSGNEKGMKKSITEAILKTKTPNPRRGLSNFFFITDDISTYRKIQAEAIREIEEGSSTRNFAEAAQHLSPFFFQQILFDGNPSFDKVIDKMEMLNAKSPDLTPGWYLNVYSRLINLAFFFGETNTATFLIAKAEPLAAAKAKEAEDNNNDILRFEQAKSNTTMWYQWEEITQGFPALMKSGQSDRIYPILERIKLPQARIFALRVIAEEFKEK